MNGSPILQRLRTPAVIAGLALLSSHAMFSQSSPVHVAYDASSRVFRMDAAEASYILCVNAEGQVQTLYWGKRLSDRDAFAPVKGSRGWHAFDPPVTTTPHEFVGWGGGIFLEPDLKITFADGNRDLVLKYVSHHIVSDKLSIQMKDISREVYVTLRYSMDAETGIVRRSAEIENRADAPFLIEQVASATYNLPPGMDYHLHFVTGRWAGEWTLQDQAIRGGKITLESRRGTTGSQNNPWFAIDRNISKDQEQGEAYFGALAWSGSWQITVEQDALQQVHVTGGLNAFDFSYHLKKGEKFETPEFDAGFSSSGLGGASRLIHRFELDSIVPQAPKPALRPILYGRSGPDSPRGESGVHWRGALCDGRRLVWSA